jgi:AbrB family looped-hinge helix DNA binding protein
MNYILSSSITQKGQVTIPIKFRQELNLLTGDLVGFDKKNNQIVMVPIKKKVSLQDLCGFLPKPKKALSTKEMDQIIQNRK